MKKTSKLPPRALRNPCGLGGLLGAVVLTATTSVFTSNVVVIGAVFVAAFFAVILATSWLDEAPERALQQARNEEAQRQRDERDRQKFAAMVKAAEMKAKTTIEAAVYAEEKRVRWSTL
jgi:UDP-N-acetylmuramyl pentapeptide phosphotransferase/UDP-N-acetylglucosamine-1-phosphate transferase